jgi:hypothetical protein
MEDDLFGILRLSLFSPGGKWCFLNSVSCIPLSSCDEYMANGRCKYEFEEDETR